MPQINRDKESLYPPGRLHVWFLFSSVALAAALLWMLGVDHFARPWKGTQRDFYRRQAVLLDAAREVEQQRVLGVGDESDEAKATRERLRGLVTKVAEADRALQAPAVKAELAALERDLEEQQALLDEAVRELKERKGQYSEKRYDYQVLAARDAAAAERLRPEVDRLDAEQAEYEAKKVRAEAALGVLKARRDVVLGPKRAAEKELAEARKRFSDVETQLASRRALTEKNTWRDMPVADIVNPATKIDKVVLDQIHDDFVFATSPKVDMCMTCHAGTAQLSMTAPAVRDLLVDWMRLKVGEKAWERGRIGELVPDRTIRDVAGRIGPGDTAPEAVLEAEKPAPAGWRPDPALQAQLDLAGLRRDWKPVDDVRGEAASPWQEERFREVLSDPKTTIFDLVPASRWAAAFDLKDAEGRPLDPGAPTLSPAQRRERLEKVEEELRKVFRLKDPLRAFRVRPVEWAHPHAELMIGAKSPHKLEKIGCTVCHAGVGLSVNFTTAAHVPDSHEEAERWEEEHGWKTPQYVDFPMLPLSHTEGQCLKCHVQGVELEPRSEALRRFTARWVTKDGAQVVEQARARAPDPVTGSMEQVDGRWRPERLREGLEAVRTYGCGGCHLIKGTLAQPGFPRETAAKDVDDRGADFSVPAYGALTPNGLPKVAWDLTHVGDKTTRDFLFRWIWNPTSYRIDTRMPSFYMWREHADDGTFGVDTKDGKPVDRLITFETDPGLQARAEAQADVEALAIADYLLSASKSRKGAYPPPPTGDAKRGAEAFYSIGCSACHLSNGVWDGSRWSGDAAARKVAPEGLLPGPRLHALASKIKDAGWVYRWLEEPRHYHSTTPMPKVTFRAVLAPDGKTEVRSEAQVRADVVAYLMDPAFRDGAFEAIPLPGQARWTTSSLHDEVLVDFWMEWYGRGQVDSPLKSPKSLDEALGFARERSQKSKPQMLAEVGKKLIGQRGCFGCHNVAGFEEAQPIGKELTREGLQDIHKFDFGMLGHEIHHTREDWIVTKIHEPRIFDRGAFKPRWQDKLRMPKFNFSKSQRDAVTTVVLGLVRDPDDPKEAIRPTAVHHPDEGDKAIAAGRAILDRYHCNQCHSIEGKMGYLTADQVARGLELWMLPPNLFGEGNRVRPEWLFSFLKDPTGPASEDGAVRPSTIQRMPTFRLSDAEVSALVDYFVRLGGRTDRLSSDPEDAPLPDTPYPQPVTITVGTADARREVTVRNLREETALLFDVANCNRCHLPKGTPGADPNEGASAPPFTLSGRRLRREWVRDMIEDPLWQIPGTKMPAFWGRRRPARPGNTRRLDQPDFLLDTRANEKRQPDDVTDAQMDAISRHVLFHYRMPNLVPEPPK